MAKQPRQESLAAATPHDPADPMPVCAADRLYQTLQQLPETFVAEVERFVAALCARHQRPPPHEPPD